MITEDYVSFETAKLLKEKGFNWNTDKQFNLDKIVGDYNITDRSRHPERYLDAPTFQMAMKWLREVHNIIIIIRLFNSAEHFYLGEPNQFTIDIASPTMSPQEGHIRSCYSTYEQALEAAIKYCLENLI